MIVSLCGCVGSWLQSVVSRVYSPVGSGSPVCVSDLMSGKNHKVVKTINMSRDVPWGNGAR